MLRQADRTKNKEAAEALRKKAASLRRAERAKVKKPAKKAVVADALSSTAEAQVKKVVRQDWEDAGQQSIDAFLNRATTGGRAPSAADNLDIKARALIVAGRKKGGEKAVTDALMQLAASMRYEGQKASDDMRREEVKAIHRVRREATIADFMASYQILLRLGQSDDPKLIGAITLAAIFDALSEAGYTAKGRR